MYTKSCSTSDIQKLQKPSPGICFKHIRDEFPWLETIDSLLLGLWKAFHFSTKNRYILNETHTTYGDKTLNVIKATMLQVGFLMVQLVKEHEKDILSLSNHWMTS